MKQYYTQTNIGKAKYCVFYHDGFMCHRDGSDFWALKILRNKKTLDAFLAKLHQDGYKPRPFVF